MATTTKRRKKAGREQPSPVIQRVSEAVTSMTTQTQEAVSEAWHELESERRREILAIPLIASALISLLAMFSYTPADTTTYTADLLDSTQPIQNWIGKPGAWLASGIIFVFGASGYSLPALLLLWGIDRWRKGGDAPVRKIRILGCVLLLVSLSSFLGLVTELMNPAVGGERVWQISGALGFMLGRRLIEFGPMGAVIINLTCIALAALLATPFLFCDFYSRVSLFLFPPRDEVEYEMENDEDEYDDVPSQLLPLLSEEDRVDRKRSTAVESDWDEYLDDDPAEGAPLESIDQNKNDGLRLKPLRENSSEIEDAPLAIDNSDWDDTPPEEENTLPAITLDNDDSNELKIVTQEDDLLQEIDLGVNLIKTPSQTEYQIPSINLLDKPEQHRPEIAREEIVYNSQILERTLKDFNITVKVVEVNYGPTITCYELEPAPGIKISRIENLANDITRSLKAESVRIVAPIPGKGTVGVEVPNRYRSDVVLREIIGCESYQKNESKLKIGLGKTISGEPFIFDLVKAPHLLVAGATGSGKSVCINTIITSVLYNAAPHEVKLLLVDPKQVELALYRDVPHLLSPVVTDPQKAGAALRWAVEEMETRYRYLKKAGVRNITEYNRKRLAQQEGLQKETESSVILPGFLPYIVIVIDELADLMMVARVEVETSVARLAAMARAVGIHLVLATQRPSVDVLTGVIKNNFPSRMAFQVSSIADSRTILDMKGADTLMGRGDMLFAPGGANKPIRLQCAYISTEEVEDVVDFVKSQQDVEYFQEEFIPTEDSSSSGSASGGSGEEEDELYKQALDVVLENDAASTSLLQRRLKIGYGRAARLLDLMEEKGIVGPPRGSKPREVVLGKMV